MLIMARGKSGRSLEDIIERVLSQPEIFVFGEFIELENVQAVSTFGKTNFSLFLRSLVPTQSI